MSPFCRAVVAVLGELGELLGAREQHVVDGTGERLLEPGDVRAAHRRGDGVDERHDRGVVALDPAQRDVDAAFALDRRHLAVDRHLLLEVVEAGERDDLGDGLAERQVVDVVGETAARHELLGLAAGTRPLVDERDLEAGHEEAHRGRRARAPARGRSRPRRRRCRSRARSGCGCRSSWARCA